MSSAAALFACAARAPQTHVCGWCFESGEGTLVLLGDRLVLNSHADCMQAVRPVICSCCDPLHAGDNPNCLVHGDKK